MSCNLTRGLVLLCAIMLPANTAQAGAAKMRDAKVTPVPGIAADKLVGDLIWTAKGDAFFALNSEGALRRIRMPSFEVEKQVELGADCVFLAQSAVGLLVARNEAQVVYLVDADTFLVTKKFPGSRLKRVLSSPKLSFALFVHVDSAGRSGDVSYVHLAKGKIESQTPLPVVNGRITPDGKYYFAQDGAEKLRRVRIEGSKLVEDGTRVGFESFCRGVCISSDSKFVSMAVSNTARKGTNVYSVDDLANPLFVLAPGSLPRHIAFDTAAKYFCTQNQQFRLVIYDMNNVKRGEWLPNKMYGEVRQFVPHPLGGKLLVATTDQVLLVELPMQDS